VKYWKLIAHNLKKAGWRFGWVSVVIAKIAIQRRDPQVTLIKSFEGFVSDD
jgi:hypothetical protein